MFTKVVTAEDETVQPISIVYGSVIILLTASVLHCLNFFINWLLSRLPPSPTSSSSSWLSSLVELNKKWTWRNILISWLHATSVGIWNLICFYLYLDELLNDLVFYYNFNIYTLAAVSTGYFLYDFFDIIKNSRPNVQWDIILHHVVVCVIFYLNLAQCRFIGFIVVALLAEVNSTFLHTRKLLQFFQVSSDHWLYRVIIYLNFVSFVCCRFFCVAWIVYGTIIFRQQIGFLYMLVLGPSVFIMLCINVGLFWKLFSNDILKPLRKYAYRSKCELGKLEHHYTDNGISSNNNKQQKKDRLSPNNHQD